MGSASLGDGRGPTRGEGNTPLQPVYSTDYEQSVATARTRLGEKAFVAAWAQGRTMTPEQVLAAQGQPLLPN